MQSHKCCLAPSGQGDEDVVSAREQDGNAHVDEAERAGPIPHIFAYFELLRQEPDVWLVTPKRNSRKDDIQDDVDDDKNAE